MTIQKPIVHLRHDATPADIRAFCSALYHTHTAKSIAALVAQATGRPFSRGAVAGTWNRLRLFGKARRTPTYLPMIDSDVVVSQRQTAGAEERPLELKDRLTTSVASSSSRFACADTDAPAGATVQAAPHPAESSKQRTDLEPRPQSEACSTKLRSRAAARVAEASHKPSGRVQADSDIAPPTSPASPPETLDRNASLPTAIASRATPDVETDGPLPEFYTLFDRPPACCRWILGRRDDLWVYCPKAAVPGRSWCAKHDDIVYGRAVHSTASAAK